MHAETTPPEYLYLFETRLGHHFATGALLQTALTHSSWTNEQNMGTEHNERIEFLGDAVLELTVSTELFRRFPTAREGDLTRLRSTLVNTQVLADLARELSLETVLKLGKGEENQGGRHRDALLADAMEAVLGAVYLDAGFIKAGRIVTRLYKNRWPQSMGNIKRKDFKTLLQEATQRHTKGLPYYVLETCTGPEHDKLFTVRVTLPDGQTFTASGHSLKRAEQEAAKKALELFVHLPEQAVRTHPKRPAKSDQTTRHS